MDAVDRAIQEYLFTRRLVENVGESEAERVPGEMIAQAKALLPKEGAISCPHCKKGITPFKGSAGSQKFKNFLWLALAVGFFGLSFGVKRYFFQWIALSLFCGIKWIMDQRSTKMQVMIYKALKEEQGSGGEGGAPLNRIKNFKS